MELYYIMCFAELKYQQAFSRIIEYTFNTYKDIMTEVTSYTAFTLMLTVAGCWRSDLGVLRESLSI